MAKPITALASRSCAKNSALKQTDIPEAIKGGPQAHDLDEYFKGLYKRFGNNVTTQELIDKKYISAGAADAYNKITGGANIGELKTTGIAPVETPKPTIEITSTFTPTEKKEPKLDLTDQGMGNLDLRQAIRQEKMLNRLERQAERRQDRFERKGLSGEDKKAKRKEQRKDRAAANVTRQKRIQDLISGYRESSAQKPGALKKNYFNK